MSRDGSGTVPYRKRCRATELHGKVFPMPFLDAFPKTPFHFLTSSAKPPGPPPPPSTEYVIAVPCMQAPRTCDTPPLPD